MTPTVQHSSDSAKPWIKPALTLGRVLLPVLCVIGFFTVMDFAIHGRAATFWSLQNLQTISVQNAFVLIAALGMLLVIVAGGIDLSAGTALALCSTIVAWGMREDVGFLIAHGDNVTGAEKRLAAADEVLRAAQREGDSARIDSCQREVHRRRQRLVELIEIKLAQLQESLPTSDESRRAEQQKSIAAVQQALASLKNAKAAIESDPLWLRLIPNVRTSAWLALMMGVGTGLACGLFNGLLIVMLRVPPFIATLGTMMIYLGLAKIVADETAVRPLALQVPPWLGELSAVRPEPAWLLVSKGVWLALALAAIVACILRHTVFGRYVFALGSNESTARLCGINVALMKLAVYAAAGLLVGIAAVCFFSRLNSGNPTSGTSLELKFIAAVVIGGGSLSGGRGTVLGTLAGTAMMGVIAGGCTLLGMHNPLQDILLGLIIIAAVAIDQLRLRR